MTSRYPLRRTRYREQIEERLKKRPLLDDESLSDESSDEDSDDEWVPPPKKKLQRKHSDSDSDVSVSDSIVNDPPPRAPRRTLNVHELGKKRRQPAPHTNPLTVKRPVTRSMVTQPVIELSSDDEDYHISIDDSVSEKQEPVPPPIMTNPPVDDFSDEILNPEVPDEDAEQQFFAALMQAQQDAQRETTPIPEDLPEPTIEPTMEPIQEPIQEPIPIPEPTPEVRIKVAPPETPQRPPNIIRLPTVEARRRKRAQEEEQARVNEWIQSKIQHKTAPAPPPKAPKADLPPPPTAPLAPSAAPQTKPKCFVNFYYTINADSYMADMATIKSLIKKRMLAIHPDKLPPGTEVDGRDMNIITYIKNNIFDTDEHRIKYNRLISAPYYAHGSGENTDIDAMTGYMEDKFTLYQPFPEFTVKSYRLVPLKKDMHKMYPADKLPPDERRQMAYGNGASSISSLAAAFMHRAPPQPHYGTNTAYGAHMSAVNNIFRAHQPQGSANRY